MVYPVRLIDYLWEFEIILWVIAIVIFYQLGFSFLRKYLKGTVESKTFNFAFCLFFFVYGTARLIEFLRSYYITFEYSLGYYDILLTNGQLTGISLLMRLGYMIPSWVSIAIFSFVLEKHILKELGYSTHYILVFLSVILSVVPIFMYITGMLWLYWMAAVAFFIYIGMFLGYILNVLVRTEGKLRQSFIYLAFGLLEFALGVLASLPELYLVLEEFTFALEGFFRIVAPILHIVAGMALSKGFQLELFKWTQKIQHIYVMMPSGVCIYDHNFRPIERDQDLVTSTLTGISTIIQEVTKSETKLKTIHQEAATLLLEYGVHATVVLQTDEDLPVLRHKLATFTAEFEAFFQEVFPVWVGDTSVFLPAKVLIDRIFKF